MTVVDYGVPECVPERMQNPYQDKSPLIRRLMQWRIGESPVPTKDQAETFAKALNQGDPVMDAYVQWMMANDMKQGRALFEQALEHGIETVENAPEELKAIFEHVDATPLWLDNEVLALGCKTIRRVGPASELVLSCVSLMGGYLGASASKPLTYTARLDSAAPRRLFETGQFWMDVTTVGNLQRDQRGFKQALRVRLMHTIVRAMVSKRETWSDQKWGVPINQADMMGTNLLFSTTFLTSLEFLGFKFSKEERESVMHLWRYIGYLMGIDERVLPANEKEGYKAAYLQYVTIDDADEDSHSLGQALMNVPYSRAEKSWQKRLADMEVNYRSGISRAFFGKKNADALGLPNNVWKYSLALSAPLTYATETIRQRVPGATWAATKLGTWIQEQGFESLAKTEEKVTFTPVQQLSR